jgi:hypothetical protein
MQVLPLASIVLGTAVLECHENFADSMHACLVLNPKRLQKHLALALLPLGTKL